MGSPSRSQKETWATTNHVNVAWLLQDLSDEIAAERGSESAPCWIIHLINNIKSYHFTSTVRAIVIRRYSMVYQTEDPGQNHSLVDPSELLEVSIAVLT